MTRFFSAGLLALGLSVGAAAAEDLPRVTGEAEFRALVVGKTLVAGDQRFEIEGDGTMSGRIPAGRVVGAWNWQQGFFCRTLRIAGEDRPGDCQVVRSDGIAMTFTRDQGRGAVGARYTIR